MATLQVPMPRLPMRIERRRLIVALGVAAAGIGWVSPGACAARAFDLAQLMKTLAQVRSGTASFIERREVAMLDRTIESSGRLSFDAPDTFIRETLKPRRDRMAVTGNTLTLSQGDRSRTMELDASPEAAVIVEAIRGTLTGNLEALERLFETTVSGSAERWSLDLVPREARLRGQVASVKVRGEQALVREVAVLLADGDRSVMTITPTAALAPKPAPDAAKLGAKPASAAP